MAKATDLSAAAAPEVSGRRVRVLYSFPHRLGAQRICHTAWQQVCGLSEAGAAVSALVGSLARPLPPGVRRVQTLSLRNWRLPYRLVGADRLMRLHDWRTARWLERHRDEIDLVHAWPLAAGYTLRVARRHSLPVLLERPNAHTRYAYAAVEAESRRLGVKLPKGGEHVFDAARLRREEKEYAAADFLLCPSDFVAKTFRDEGYPEAKLLRHRYGYDPRAFHAHGRKAADPQAGLVVLYAGIGTPRKGLHLALEAWLASGAQRRGSFLVCGELLPVYRDRIAPLLQHPSVQVLGQRSDLADVMRRCDVFVLPTVEEGSALVTYEARASGCVLAVSDASGAVCEHMENALVHRVGDLGALTYHLTLLDQDRALLERLRESSLATTGQLTWRAAGTHLLQVYREALNRSRPAGATADAAASALPLPSASQPTL